jgi:hypothetical protein
VRIRSRLSHKIPFTGFDCPGDSGRAKTNASLRQARIHRLKPQIETVDFFWHLFHTLSIRQIEDCGDVDVLLLINVARFEVILLIASFGIVTLWKLLQSASFAGLLRSNDGTLSPGRIQLLVITVLTALQYLLATIQDPSHMPTISPNLVMALGGSQGVYLGAKALDIFGLIRKK